MIHMKCQVLFSLENTKKETIHSKCQVLFLSEKNLKKKKKIAVVISSLRVNLNNNFKISLKLKTKDPYLAVDSKSILY